MVKRVVGGCVLLTLVLLPLAVTAQDSAPETWVRVYSTDPRSTALHGLATADGGYLLVGATHYSHQNHDSEDIHLMKLDAAGDVLWEQALGGEQYDRGVAVQAAANGGYVVLAETRSFGAGGYDIQLIGIDAEGAELWSHTYGGPGTDRAQDIQPTADGGYIIAGSTVPTDGDNDDAYLLRVDAAGNVIWERAYDEGHYEAGYAVHELPNGDFFVVGDLQHGSGMYPAQDPDVFVLRTDAEGTPLWISSWPAPDTQGAFELLPLPDETFVITGIVITGASYDINDFLLMKLDADGNLLWDQSFGEAGRVDYGTDIVAMPDGGYLLTGLSMRRGSSAIPLVKTDGDGALLWRQELVEGPGVKAALVILDAHDGGYLLVAQTDEGGRGFETLLIKTDADEHIAP